MYVLHANVSVLVFMNFNADANIVINSNRYALNTDKREINKLIFMLTKQRKFLHFYEGGPLFTINIALLKSRCYFLINISVFKETYVSSKL